MLRDIVEMVRNGLIVLDNEEKEMRYYIVQVNATVMNKPTTLYLDKIGFATCMPQLMSKDEAIASKKNYVTNSCNGICNVNSVVIKKACFKQFIAA